MSWTVIEFLESMTVEAVPSGWLLNNKCYWPTMPREKIVGEIRRNTLPNTCWPLYDIRVFKDATFDNYKTARNKAKKAEYTSDLNSQSETEGKRRVTARKFSTSSSESDVKDLLRLGGRSNYDFIKRCLQQTLTNNLAEKYSYFWAKKKRPFKELKLNKVLLRAAEMLDNSDEKHTEDSIKKWLRRAKERQNTKKDNI